MNKKPIKQAIHGIRGQELQDAIVPLVRKPTAATMLKTTLAFTLAGEHDELTDEYGEPVADDKGFPLLYDIQNNQTGKITPAEELKNAYAKVTYTGTKARYYVKRSGSGKFYNPIGTYEEGRHTKQLKHAGKAEWEYKEVNNRVFINYLNFLRSRNLAWLLNAEREAI